MQTVEEEHSWQFKGQSTQVAEESTNTKVGLHYTQTSFALRQAVQP